MFKIFFLFFLSFSFSFANNISFHEEIFPSVEDLKKTSITDTISENPINTTIQIAYDKNGKKLGFIREVNTTTGCNSACLPVIFTLYYNTKYEFLKLKSKAGLTKKFHKPMTVDDINRLHLLIGINPEVFKKVKHPTDMTDALTGATKPEFVDAVVKEAAYSTLRINTYNQDTIRQLKSLKL
ncbi:MULTISPECIES: hypothetical protein [unclassified Halobacteriovorax]|uniref:hypothetical protein n=1 Tax=unclassified Halobacteriovorax TaxID=2639665 RepID=UPI00399AA305